MPFGGFSIEGFSGDLFGWCIVIAGLGVYACLVRLGDRRAAGRRLSAEPDSAAIVHLIDRPDVALELGPDRPDVAAIQAQAKVQVDASEHAFNRLLRECAGVMTLTVEPTFTPGAVLPRQTALVEAKPLAA